MICEVTTNKATNDCREVTLANHKLIVRRPKTMVTEENYRILQFLDLMKDIDFYSEIKGDAQKKRLVTYMTQFAIRFSDLEQYLRYYPDKIYKNMYQAGLLNGISTQG